MPRHLDEGLENKVLEAARKLWVKGGGTALTIRKVAKMAGTTPPALYRRFRDRDAILKALVDAYLENFLREIEPTRSPKEFALRILEIALRRPQEYELFLWGLRQGVTEARPVAQLFMQRCVEAFGGLPSDYVNLALALRALLRGTAMHVMDNQVAVSSERMKEAYARAVDILVENERQLRPAEKGKVH